MSGPRKHKDTKEGSLRWHINALGHAFSPASGIREIREKLLIGKSLTRADKKLLLLHISAARKSLEAIERRLRPCFDKEGFRPDVSGPMCRECLAGIAEERRGKSEEQPPSARTPIVSFRFPIALQEHANDLA